MRMIDVLMYFVLTCCATVIGVCYAMALETMRNKNFKVIWVYVLSILVTPIGAWIVSTIVRPSKPEESPAVQQEPAAPVAEARPDESPKEPETTT